MQAKLEDFLVDDCPAVRFPSVFQGPTTEVRDEEVRPMELAYAFPFLLGQ